MNIIYLGKLAAEGGSFQAVSMAHRCGWRRGVVLRENSRTHLSDKNHCFRTAFVKHSGVLRACRGAVEFSGWTGRLKISIFYAGLALFGHLGLFFWLP